MKRWSRKTRSNTTKNSSVFIRPIRSAIASAGCSLAASRWSPGRMSTHRNSPDAYASFVSRFGDSDLVRAARRLQERPRLVNIAFPKRDEGRFGDGRFGNGGIKIGNLGNNRPVIDFPRGNGGRPVIGFPQNGNSNNGRPVINPQDRQWWQQRWPSGYRLPAEWPEQQQRPFPNGSTHRLSAMWRPVSTECQQRSRTVRVIPFPRMATPASTARGRPGQVAKPAAESGNGGINPNAGRPIINRPQIGNQGINPNVGRPPASIGRRSVTRGSIRMLVAR